MNRRDSAEKPKGFRYDVNGLVECDECGLIVEDEHVYSGEELVDDRVVILCDGCARLYGTEG